MYDDNTVQSYSRCMCAKETDLLGIRSIGYLIYLEFILVLAVLLISSKKKGSISFRNKFSFQFPKKNVTGELIWNLFVAKLKNLFSQKKFNELSCVGVYKV